MPDENFRTYEGTGSRQIIDYHRFMELTGEKIFICLDRGVLEIAKYMLNSRAQWKTTYSTEYQQFGYITPTDEEFKNISNAIAEANIDMASCEDITTELAGIKDAILALVDKPCCPSGTTTGSRGSGSTGRPPNPYDGAETPETPPEGFGDMEEYNSHKCNAAQDLLNNLRSDLLGLSGIIYSGSTPTGLAGALILFFLTPIPFDDLIGLAAYLIYSAYSYAFLAEMSNQMSEENENLICVLYNGTSPETVETDFLSALEEIALAHFTTEDDAEWVMGAIEYMLTYDAYNILFEDVPTTSQDADCSSCNSDGPILYTCIYPEIPDFNDDGYMILVAENAGGDYFLAYGFDGTKNYTITLESGSYTTPAAVGSFMTAEKYPDATFCGLGAGAGWDSITTSFPSSTWVSPGTIQLRSGTPFSARFTPFD